MVSVRDRAFITGVEGGLGWCILFFLYIISRGPLLATAEQNVAPFETAHAIRIDDLPSTTETVLVQHKKLIKLFKANRKKSFSQIW